MEHQRHERELIHKNLPSSDSRDGPLQLDKTPTGGDPVEGKTNLGYSEPPPTHNQQHIPVFLKHWSKFAYNWSKNKR